MTRDENLSRRMARRAAAADVPDYVQSLRALLTTECERRQQLEAQQRHARDQMREFLLELVEVLDSFDDYFADIAPKEADASPQTKAWLGYFRSVYRKLEGALNGAGIERIEAADGKAVPGRHTIEDTEPQPGAENDAILVERRKGYLWRGDVLRKATVVAVKNS